MAPDIIERLKEHQHNISFV